MIYSDAFQYESGSLQDVAPHARKFRSQTSDLWTEEATVVRRVREERERVRSEESEKGETEERRSKCAKR